MNRRTDDKLREPAKPGPLRKAAKKRQAPVAPESGPEADQGREKVRRVALMSFMVKRNLTPGVWAAKAGISPNTLYNYFRSLTDSLTLSTIDRLATAAGAKIYELIGEGHPDALGVDTIKLFVKGTVGGGPNTDYSPGWLPRNQWILVNLPDTWNWLFPGDDVKPDETAKVRPYLSLWRPLSEPFAYVVIASGDSMDLVYPDGTLLICERLRDEAPLHNQHVIVETSKPGQDDYALEARLYKVMGGEIWLWPESSSPLYQSPKKYIPDQPMQIIATVYASYRPEIIR